ncbi:MAG: clan AA aspartic protease [Chloroflexota bacterium]|nr:clan AA aspartic protease [Chloroflexota bacterium]MDE2961014.1 clan AA aspartic protease [Chloroflexota bacterium]
MIEGMVNDAYEPVVTLALQGPAGQTREIEAVIDTGFSGFLTVTPALAAELGMHYRGRGWATLADGSEVTFNVYAVTVLWDGHPRYIEADAADTTPLVGMQLLDRHSLYLEIEDGGRVVIQARE